MTTWSNLINIASGSASNAVQFAQTNPAMACAAVAGAGGLTVLAVPAVVAAPAIGILNLAGFGSAGVVAGELLIHPELNRRTKANMHL